MGRRSRTGGKTTKARHSKTVTRKRRDAPKAERPHSFAGTDQTELARVIRERDEALEQQTAIRDILRVISNSPSDVQPVLELGRRARRPHLRGTGCRCRHRR